MMFASGAIWNITPRQTAGADGPKSLRKVITGRAMSARPDRDRRVDHEPEALGHVALVVGQRDRPRRVLVEQRLADGNPAERLLPGQLEGGFAIDLDPEAAPAGGGPHRAREAVRDSCKPGVPEAVDVGDPGLEPALMDPRRGHLEPDQLARVDRRADVGECRAGREVGPGPGDYLAPLAPPRGDAQPQ